MRLLVVVCLPCLAAAQTWIAQSSGTTASLRGISAATDKVVWASGTGGTYLRTVDGGATWQVSIVPGAESLDFRDVEAISADTAYLLGIGPGDKSRVYKTTDAGSHWTLQLTNPDVTGFFDEMAFWDAQHGILVGDQVRGELVVMTTADGGAHWQRRAMPPALSGEGCFAASGTGIVVQGKSELWIGSGGKDAARVFHSPDSGGTWSVAATPIRHDAASAGIFSIAFQDPTHGIAVGGDYQKPKETTGNIALTEDGGETWKKPSGNAPGGFRSAVAYIASGKFWIATGTSGSDISFDGGQSWRPFDTGNYNAISFVSPTAGWAAGPNGRIARFSLK